MVLVCDTTFVMIFLQPGAAAAVKPGGRKKDEDADTSPLLQVNSLKNQRVIDEQKLKVWISLFSVLSMFP